MGKRRAAGKIGENINCFLLNEKYMLFGGKIKMNQYDEALKKETAFLGQPRGGWGLSVLYSFVHLFQATQ